MLRNPTVDALHRMHLTGMAAGFEAQRADPNCRELVFEDRFGLLVDAEWAARENRRLSRLLKRAKLKIAGACVEDIDYASHRGLDRKQISALTNCEWVERGQHLLITGPTGVGKTWLGCAFGNLAAANFSQQDISTLQSSVGGLQQNVSLLQQNVSALQTQMRQGFEGTAIKLVFRGRSSESDEVTRTRGAASKY